MTTEIDRYFASIAQAATAQLTALNPSTANGEATIADTAQSMKAAAWQATAVHPLQVLETEYQAAVRQAGAKATSDQDRSERQNETLSRFFSLGTHKPVLLELPACSIATDLERDPLIEARLRALHAELGLARSLIETPSGTDTPLGVMSRFVDKAVALLVAIIPDQRTRNLPPGLQQAVDYLGLFNPHTPSEASQNWLFARQNITQPDQLRQLADELNGKLLRPLEDPGNAVASVRGLYNIKPFYLYRLLHRFHGGSAEAQMDIDTKGKASGLVTEFMHAKRFDWLAAWHERQIAALDSQIGKLDLALRNLFDRSDPALRFYLKGGRALFTALGDPQEGKNDWDTGVLIDPSLPPDQWYLAMAAVNDTVMSVLDKLRFGYTQLLCEHLPELADWHKPPTMDLEDGEDVARYTRLGTIADAQIEQAALGAGTNVHLLSDAVGHSALLLGALAGEGAAPVGVNGELIDIGIPTRSSIELRELWNHLSIEKKSGASQTPLPVPELAYFIDDFSTIIREALVTQGPVDRKLAKRLERLHVVLAAADAELEAAVAQRVAQLAAAMPVTLKALGIGPDGAPADPADRLRIWSLAGLISSVTAGDPLARQPWLGAFDSFTSDLVHAGRLYDPKAVEPIWTQIADAFAKAADGGKGAQDLLIVQQAAHMLAQAIAKSFAAREIALGVSSLGTINPAALWPTVTRIFTALARQPSRQGAGGFAITGALAARMQGMHATLDGDSYASAWPVELIDAAIEVDNLDLAHNWLQQIASFAPADIARDIVGDGRDARLRFFAPSIAVQGPIVEDRPVILSVRPVAKGTLAPTMIDMLYTYPVLTSRALARDLTIRAADMTDYDLREMIEATNAIVMEQILGRQI